MIRGPAAFAIALAIALAMTGPVAGEPLKVYGAGSLRPALTDAARAFDATGQQVQLVFGASGLLRERIAGGEPADVFASANMEHPQALAGSGGWQPVRVFARNSLCALAPASSALTTEGLIGYLLDPRVKVGTSTPVADPSGDYAFEMFARIGRQPGAVPGARDLLEAKALQLTGGPGSPPPPAGRSVYGTLVAEGKADVFITYCTNAAVAVAERPQLRATRVPAAVDVTADYGVTIRRAAGANATAFTDFLLSAQGRDILGRHGFALP